MIGLGNKEVIKNNRHSWIRQVALTLGQESLVSASAVPELACRLKAPPEMVIMQWKRNWIGKLNVLSLALLALPLLGFAAYSLRFGLRGLGLDLSDETYIFTPDGPAPNLAIFSHMILGAAVMVLVPLQLSRRLRARYPRLHRTMGRVIVIASMIIALGGLQYIVIRGTNAGPLMDLGFAANGVLMFGAATQAFRYARAGDFSRHREWALRLFVLIMGSLIFRLHYAIWYSLTDGLWSNEQLTGPFDQLQYFAFYLPYLLILEVWLKLRPVRLLPGSLRSPQ
jgi:uncharacterized membrane protein